MVQIKQIGVLSAAKITGIWYAILGLFGGAIFSIMALVGVGLDRSGGGDAAMAGIVTGAGAIVCFPLLYGAIGFVFGALGAFVYNLVAGMIGGIEIELSE